jgi:hypothetical protein
VAFLPFALVGVLRIPPLITCLAKLFAIFFLTSASTQGIYGGEINGVIFGAELASGKIIENFPVGGNYNDCLALDNKNLFNLGVVAYDGETCCRARVNFDLVCIIFDTYFLPSPIISPMMDESKNPAPAFGTSFDASVVANAGATQCQARANRKGSYSSSPFIYPVEEVKKKTTITGTQNDHGDNYDRVSGEPDVQHPPNYHTPNLPSPSIFQVEDQEEDWRCFRASYNINFLSSPFIFPMKGTKKKTGGFARALCNYIASFSFASTSTQSTQDENENYATNKSCSDGSHTRTKMFNFLNPRVPGEPFQHPPKRLDGEPVPDNEVKAKNVNADVAPPLKARGKSTLYNNDNIHWTSQQKGLSDREGSSAGAPDGIDGTVAIRDQEWEVENALNTADY